MKRTIKALAVLMAVLFCASALVLAVGAAGSETYVPFNEKDTFSFGSYPQTWVKDEDTLYKLNVIRDLTKEDVIKLNGVTYYAYTIEENSKPGGPFGVTYGYTTFMTYWFRCEPITWRVLESDANSKLLLSEYVLCAHVFNEEIRADNTWENSDVRKWLNNEFLNTAFTAKEQVFLQDSALANEDNPVHGSYNGVPSAYAGDYRGGYPYCGTESGNDTVDKVFLPSFNEITNKAYGFNVECNTYGDFGQFVGYYEEGEKSGRQAGSSDYAQCQGVWTHLDKDKRPLETNFYWLRTAGLQNGYAAGVLPDGRVSTGWEVDYSVLGIRPMIRVDADAVADNSPSEPEDLPFHVSVNKTEFYYKQRDVHFTADTDVTWSSSDPRIAEIDADGNLTIHRVGTVTITATSKETGKTVDVQVEITYRWWQHMIRIFLFGWIWY